MGIVTGYLSQLVSSGTDQSMKVKNYPFVYPRSFVGTWIIKYQ